MRKRDGRSRWMSLFCGMVASASLLVVGVADASRPAVELGRVSAEERAELERVLRVAAERELERMDLSDANVREHYVLDVRLSKLQAKHERGRYSATAVVSATLTRAKGGALLAILKGRGRAEQARPKNTGDADRSAVKAAVRGAVRRLPEALKR